MNDNEIFEFLRNGIVKLYHGAWYDFIVPDESTRDRTYKLAGEPVYDEGFRSLYHLEPGENKHKSFIIDIIPKKDRKRVILNLRRALEENENSPTVPELSNLRLLGDKTDRGSVNVEILHKKLSLPNGQKILASFHYNLSAFGHWHEIQRTVSENVPGFIFVKEWSPERDQFEFRYVNRRLADTLGLSSPSNVIGMTDDQFLSDPGELMEVQRNDLEIRDAEDTEIYRSYEETLHISIGERNRARRYDLLTIKTPLARENTSFHQVLGMSIDVSFLNLLLQEGINQIDTALYIKDAKRRYVAINSAFRAFLGAGAPEKIIGKTFEQIIDAKTKFLEDEGEVERLRGLAENIKKEDKSLLKAAYNMTKNSTVAPISLTEQDCISSKRAISPPISASEGNVDSLFSGRHIIGTLRPIFDSAFSNLLNDLPQEVCLKRQNGTFVWANDNFLDNHAVDRNILSGMTDFDFSQSPDDAEKFQLNDRKAIRIGKEYWKLQKELGVSDWANIDRKGLHLKLSEEDLIHFSEFQHISGREPRELITSKIPALISNEWHVWVIYSDATTLSQRIDQFHRASAHSLKTPVSLIKDASERISSIVSSSSVEDELKEICVNLQDGAEEVIWFLDCQLDLAHMNVRATKQDSESLVEIVNRAIKLLRARKTEVELKVDTDGLPETVIADLNFSKAIIFELFKNAETAIGRRARRVRSNSSFSKDLRATEAKPRIEAKIHSRGKKLHIDIMDSGIAACVEVERQRLEDAFESHRKSAAIRFVEFGLPFCIESAIKQGGELKFLGIERSLTNIRLTFRCER